jgi:ribosomal protein S12 methylthiotransferase accessory factor YcaO
MRKNQSVLSARKAALRMGLTECIERAASPQALLSFRLLDRINYGLVLHATIGRMEDKVMAGGTPANPASLDLRASTII